MLSLSNQSRWMLKRMISPRRYFISMKAQGGVKVILSHSLIKKYLSSSSSPSNNNNDNSQTEKYDLFADLSLREAEGRVRAHKVFQELKDRGFPVKYPPIIQPCFRFALNDGFELSIACMHFSFAESMLFYSPNSYRNESLRLDEAGYGFENSVHQYDNIEEIISEYERLKLIADSGELLKMKLRYDNGWKNSKEDDA